jgi:ABC-2 type transport system ATP-binding protein
MDNIPVIDIKNISKQFGKIKVLDDISFSVEKGDFFGLLGPNGAGKTTLIKIITGQISPDKGQAWTLSIPHFNSITVKSLVGIVPEAETPPTFLTSRETLELTCRIRDVNDLGKIDSWLKFFDLEHKQDILCRDLSKGERQKLMLAAAFIHEPKVLLVDEPFINLDPIYQRKVREYLRNIVLTGRTVFMCTHILDIADRLCTKIAIINEGKIMSKGTLEELREFDNERLEDIFIRMVEHPVFN